MTMVGWRRSVSVVGVTAAVLLGACSGGGGGEDVRADAGPGAASPSSGGNARELSSGSDGPPTAGEIVATSPEEWKEKWAASGATAEAPEVTDVDFTREVAVAIFAGEKSSGGWKIDPEVEVKTQGVFSAISYVVIGPGDGCSSSQAMTSPYLALAVKGERVRFSDSERLDPCE